MPLKRKPPSWLDCMVCGKTVEPGSGRVYYPLPIEQRRMLPVRLQAWTQAMKHDDCPLPPSLDTIEEEGHWNDPDGDPSDD